MSGLDGALLDEFTQGFNAPNGVEDAGKAVVVDEEGTNLKYIPALAGIASQIETDVALNDAKGVTPKKLEAYLASAKGVDLYPYLQRTSQFTDAVAMALTSAAGAECRKLILPAGTFAMNRYLGFEQPNNDGFRDDICFEGQHTKIILPAAGQLGLYFPPGSARIKFTNVHLLKQNPAAFGQGITAYGNVDWLISDCTFEAAPAAGLSSGCGLALIGSTNIVVQRCTFRAAQCGFGGYGWGIRGAKFLHNQGYDVDDFLISAVSGIPNTGSGYIGVRDVSIIGNHCEGTCGAGFIFAGSDGQGSLASELKDLRIEGNTYSGALTQSGPSPASFLIGVVMPVDTDRVSIDGNKLSDSNVIAGLSGILVIADNGASAGTRLGVKIRNNELGALGLSGGAYGVDLFSADYADVSGNECRGNRGVRLTDVSDADIDRNKIFAATSDGLSVLATTRAAVYRARGNVAHSVGSFKHGHAIYSTGGFGVTARLSGNNKFTSAAGNSIGFARLSGAGNCSLRITDSEVPQTIVGTGLTVAYARGCEGQADV